MTHITITPAPGTWEARVGDRVIARSARALEMREGGYPPVHYFPREDSDAALLEPTTRATTCPHKGNASYLSIVTPDLRLDNAVWSYQTPKQELAAIAGHLAFYTDRVTVRQA